MWCVDPSFPATSELFQNAVQDAKPVCSGYEEEAAEHRDWRGSKGLRR